MSDPRAARPGPLLATAAICAIGVAALYWLAVRTRPGQELDGSSLGALDPERNPIAYDATDDLLHTIEVSSLGLLGLAIVGLALLRGRIALAAGAALLILGANVTTQLLKDSLERPALYTDDTVHNSYPSGHVTAATSLALGLVLVAPSQVRALAAAIGGLYAAGIGSAVILLDWHRPSDVLGAYLVSATWCALAGALAASGEASPRREPSARTKRVAVVAAAILVGVFVVAGARAVMSRGDVLELVADRTAVATGIAVAVIGAALCLGAMAALLVRARVGDPPASTA